jgi:lactoylglutathione lyase
VAVSLGAYCINVRDLETSVAFYAALGLPNASRTEIPEAFEAIMAHPTTGSRLQLAQQRNKEFHAGNAFWKLYVNTQDIEATFAAAVAAGATVESAPERLERWPVTIAFVRDPDGYLVELVQRHPWPDTEPTDQTWLGQYCINVTNIDATIAFYELLGLTCTSRTEIPVALEAILESPDGVGGKLQLAQQHDLGGEFDMGSVWKLYVNTDDAHALHDRAVAAGFPSLMVPTPLERWPVIVGFIGDPDGYQIELVQRVQS